MTAFLQRLARNRLAAAGGAMLALIVLVALAVPLLPLQDPNATATAERFARPLSEGHLLGTDHLGRDLLSRLAHGTRLSLAMGFAAALIAAVLGSVLGIVAGFLGGRVDNVIMRGVDMLMGFPYVLLALAIVAALGPGLVNALIAVAAVNVPFFARNIRGVTVALAGREFVDAARLSGMGNLRIMAVEILPNVLPVIVIALTTTTGWMILETAGLSFLGLGSQPPQADLGSMLGEARAALISHPHVAVVPGVMIFLVVMSINLFGDGVRDALDPRLGAGALTRPLPATVVDRPAPPPLREPDPPALLAIDDLRTEFRLGRRVLPAVDGVSLSLGRGEAVGLVGESGSGKSVTALSVMRLVASPPGVIAGGAVRLDGEEVIGAPFEVLRALRGRRVAYVFQDPQATLHPLYRIGDQLAEAIRAHQPMGARAARVRALELLRDVRMPRPEDRIDDYPHQLSGGQRQRVGIAMALANNPDVIIADEPTTALDVTVQAQILALLERLRRERGLSILFITHDFGVVAQLCERLAVMYAGRIVEEGPTAEVLAAPAHPYTRRLIACVPEPGAGRRRLEAIPGLPPRLDALPPGCAFAPRCHRARPDCGAGDIPLRRAGARAVRCLHPETTP
ncbi:peptide/nickel transport system permease protein [Meinhardsimonia xiamenensis]|jgi:peptide/nickel transport system permease protein|uniref:Peptide/nickel transport system permease protein n=1 Tax=Meinhardsimonia xiamenensis TaxID=990712 RepID=A0A1G9FAJ1_9RHOB|nr:dipeptide/oligopeptide/nickel ABC transporter permease/ATP-binding protein [Meinhardsimonia xiamenensis]PRX37922.1 peptide/nickel transport system permease protein [Meinhardsimonia xiamenensis]SDK85432.1 peptide/nickel transport system permease protein [Meinhardsimonia xiamenensis]